MKKLLAIGLLLISWSAMAADNAVILDPGTTVTMRTKDIGGGVQSPFNILGDTSGNAIYGTAGTANSNVLSIQGIASMTPLLSAQSGTWTVQPGNTANTTPWLTTISQGGNSATVSAGGALLVEGVGVAQGSSTSGQTLSPIGCRTLTAVPTDSNATTNMPWCRTNGTQAVDLYSFNGTLISATAPIPVRLSNGTAAQVGDPCTYGTKLYVPIAQTTSTQLITGTASNRTYVCHIFVMANAAESITLVSGTGSVCGTSTGAMIGATTALSALSANGGYSLVGGGTAIAKSDTDADNVCLLQDGSDQLTGVISYVVAPN